MGVAATFDEWISALETRHLADLTFPEVSRALRALSSTYVERRQRIGEGAALSGAGKRAAFALFYGPLHFLLVREIAGALDATRRFSRIVDLGCGTGAAGAAWATAGGRVPDVLGIDRHPWALEEAAWTYRLFGLRARTARGDLAQNVESGSGQTSYVESGFSRTLPRTAARCHVAFLAAFALNELPRRTRDALFQKLLEWNRAGAPVLVVEPLARASAPWWEAYRRQAASAGGRADEWRFRADLPPIVARLDRAAGLDHRELTGRSLWLP